MRQIPMHSCRGLLSVVRVARSSGTVAEMKTQKGSQEVDTRPSVRLPLLIP
jgi:hypothetical protein